MEQKRLFLLASCLFYLVSLTFLINVIFQKEKVVWIPLFVIFISLGSLYLSLYSRKK